MGAPQRDSYPTPILLSAPTSPLLPTPSSANSTKAAAITQLTESWTKDTDQLKLQWVAQVAADRQIQEAEEAHQQGETDQAAADAAKIAEEERLEAEKKKPKLGDFDVNSAPPSFIESPISLFAQRKIDLRQYCLLWPFTPTGLKEAAEARLSSIDDILSLKLSRNDENQLTVQSGPSSTAHKNMCRNENLTWCQFSLGSNHFIKEIIRAGYSTWHIQALTQFFYALEQHNLHAFETDSENILKIYASRFCAEWFRTLGGEQSFNIVIIEEKHMGKISDEYFSKKRVQQIASHTV
ncbi:hypothetical protein B0H10DRAFT_1942750 [Mycena sp. CBHHK59/15]|nr:hypothetical protein B0H10DRAFT_1942750 [Mycena sp. CBHHK59/15]